MTPPGPGLDPQNPVRPPGPGEPPTTPPDEEIPDNPPPTTAPETDISDENIPTAEPEVEVSDDIIPLAEVPKTGVGYQFSTITDNMVVAILPTESDKKRRK